MQNPVSSLAFMKQDFGCNPTSQGLGWEKEFLRQMNEKRISRQEREKCKASATLSNPRMRDGSSRILSAPTIESFRYQRNTHTPSKNQSPSSNGSHRYGPTGGHGPTGAVRNQITIETPVRDQGPSRGAHRYGKSREGTRTQSNRIRKDFMIQPSIDHEKFIIQPSMNHEKSILASIEPSWTPVDKRARQVCAYNLCVYLFFVSYNIYCLGPTKSPCVHSCRNFRLQHMGRKNKASWSGDTKTALMLDLALGKGTGKKPRRLSGTVMLKHPEHVLWRTKRTHIDLSSGVLIGKYDPSNMYVCLIR